MITGYDAVCSAQRRLDDEDAVVWSYNELFLYVKDGYNQLCRRTKCLFDLHVIENVPQIGNWGTDLERHLVEQTPGMQLTDNRIHFTAEHERDARLGNAVGGSTEGSVQGTSDADRTHIEDFNISTRVGTGRLPDETVDVLRVTWDELELPPEGSATMRKLDIQYEQREGGDPRHFVFDKDGLLNIRLVPPARGDADYPTIDGSWGTMVSTTDTDVTVVSLDPVYDAAGNPLVYGLLREVEGAFPAGGPYGSPTRQHPSAKNIVVEIARLGRSHDQHPFEIPSTFIKFVIFWAMYRALKRDGPGQDLKLAEHFKSRFDMGVDRMKVRLRKVHKERILKMGCMGTTDEPFGMGDPTLPYPYGPATGRIR